MKTHAFPLQLAKEAILLGKYTEAINLLKPLAKTSTNLDAQFLHAYLHFFDDDLDRVNAIDQLTQVANQDHAEANYVLAACPELIPSYKFSLPQTESHFQQLKMAADLGSVAAITDLAECYLTGTLVEKDNEKVQELLRSPDRKLPAYPKNYFLLGKAQLDGIIPEQEENEGYNYLRASSYHLLDSYSQAAVEIGLEITRTIHNENLVGLNRDIENFQKTHDKLAEKRSPQWESYLHHYCLHTFVYDLRGADFDSFCDFVFDHYSVLWRDRSIFKLARQAKVIFHPNELVRFYTELFHDPEFLIDKYSVDQILQGFGMDGIRGWADWTIGCAMAHESTTLEEVEACIHAMYGLFTVTFG